LLDVREHGVSRFGVVGADGGHLPAFDEGDYFELRREIAEGDNSDGGVQIELGQLDWRRSGRLQTICLQALDGCRGYFSVGDCASRDGAEGQAASGGEPVEVGGGNDALGGAVLADEQDGANRGSGGVIMAPRSSARSVIFISSS
jgi:hypothetical protein